MRQVHKTTLFLLITTILSLLFRYWYLLQFQSSPLFSMPLGPDVQEYDAWAKNILAGAWLWKETPIHAPLYPFFLACVHRIFELNYFGIRFTQLGINFLAGLPIFLLAIKIAGKTGKMRFLPYIFFLFWAFYPPLIYYQAELISEALLLPLISTLLYVMYLAEEKERSVGFAAASPFYVISGILAAMAILTHPFSVFFIGAEFIYLFLKAFWAIKKHPGPGMIFRFSHFFCYAGCIFVLVAPLCVYNSIQSGELTFIQKNSGFNLYLGNNPNADGTCYLRPGPDWDRVHSEAETASAAAGLSKDQYFLGQALGYIISHPMDSLSLALRKAFFVFNFHELTAGADVKPLRYHTQIQRYSSWSFGVVAVLALTAIAMGIGNPEFRKGYRHFLILVIALFLAQVLFVTSGRYRVAMMPGLKLFAVYAICFFLENIRNKRQNIKFAACVLVAIMIVWIPRPPETEASEEAEANGILGEAYLKSGDLKKAKTSFEQSIKKSANWSRSHNLLGTLHLETNEWDLAQKCFQEAIAVNPGSPMGYMNMGILHLKRGNHKEAGKWLGRALSIDSGLPEAIFNYALFLQNNNDPAAMEYYDLCLRRQASHRQALNNSGVLALQTGDFPKAIERFTKALALTPDDPRLFVNLAAANLAAGDKVNAVHYAEKALRLKSDLVAAKKILEMANGKTILK